MNFKRCEESVGESCASGLKTVNNGAIFRGQKMCSGAVIMNLVRGTFSKVEHKGESRARH